MIAWKLATRNLSRHLRRTLVTVAGMALGVGLFIFYDALKDGFWDEAVASAIQGTAGHVVVQAKGWQNERDPALVLADSSGIATALRSAYPGATVLRRAWIGGLLTSANGAAPVEIEGVEASAEAGVTRTDEQIVRGAWLRDDDDRGVVLGEVLARVLGVDVGDKVVLMASVGAADVDGVLLRVRGVFESGSAMVDGTSGVANLRALQAALPVKDGAHQVAVIVGKGRPAELDPTPARAVVRDPAADVLTWHEAIPLLDEQRALDSKAGLFINVLLGCVIIIGVLNTVLMSVMERMREFGVLMALGTRPAQLRAMVLVEGAITGVMGGVVGIALGWVLCWPLHVWGIDFGAMMDGASPVPGVALAPVIHGTFSWRTALVACWIAPISSLAASLWPAWIASRVQPIEAMHHV